MNCLQSVIPVTGLNDKATLRRLNISATQPILSEWFSGWGFLGLYMPMTGDDPSFIPTLVGFKTRYVEKDAIKANLCYKISKSLLIEWLIPWS